MEMSTKRVEFNKNYGFGMGIVWGKSKSGLTFKSADYFKKTFYNIENTLNIWKLINILI